MEGSSKPVAVTKYNADQMGAYSSCLQRPVKWYHKVAIDLMLNISLTNALTLYNMVTKTNI